MQSYVLFLSGSFFVCLFCTMRNTCKQMITGNDAFLPLNLLKSIFTHLNLEVNKQECANEFLVFLLTHLQELQLKHLQFDRSHALDVIFSGSELGTVTCKMCGCKSKKEDPFMVLKFPVQGIGSLEEALLKKTKYSIWLIWMQQVFNSKHARNIYWSHETKIQFQTHHLSLYFSWTGMHMALVTLSWWIKVKFPHQLELGPYMCEGKTATYSL